VPASPNAVLNQQFALNAVRRAVEAVFDLAIGGDVQPAPMGNSCEDEDEGCRVKPSLPHQRL